MALFWIIATEVSSQDDSIAKIVTLLSDKIFNFVFFMAKLLKIIGKTLLGTLEWLFIFIIIFAFAIRASSVQTLLAKQATDFLSKKLEHTLTIGKVDFLFYNKLILDDVYVEDVNHDTLANIKQVNVTMNYLLLKTRHLNLRKVELIDGAVFLKKDSTTQEFNFQYLVDFFATDKKKKSKPFKISVDYLGISNFHFKMDDETKEEIDFGVDYAHLDAKKIYLSARKINMKGNNIRADIRHLSLREKSGFVLAKLSTLAQLTNNGLFMANLSILTPSTDAKLPKLNFWMRDLTGFSDFIDEVAFDAIMNYSTVDMRDVSYFAPTLEGMDEQIRISAKVTEKVKNLKISDLKLDLREKTTLQGDLSLPDFRVLENEEIKQHISYAYFDINEVNDIKLPLGSEVKKLNLDEIVQRFQYAELKNVSTSGKAANLFVQLNKINTGLGSVTVNNQVNIYQQDPTTIVFREIRKAEDELPIVIQDFELGKLLQQNNFGIVDGAVHLSGNYSSKDGITLEGINGLINRFDFNNYHYTNISLKDIRYQNNEIDGIATIADPNLNLNFNGTLNFGEQQSYVAQVDINRAFVNRLNLFQTDSLFFVKGRITADVYGNDLNSYSGFVQLDSLILRNGSKRFFTKGANVELASSETSNAVYLTSDILDATVKGTMDFASIGNVISNTLSYSLPTFISYKETKNNLRTNQFDYTIHLKNINPILHVFMDKLLIEPGTKIYGQYSDTDELSLTVDAPSISYNGYKTNDLKLLNHFTKEGMDVNYTIRQFNLNDTLKFDDIHFLAEGTTDLLASSLDWDLNTPNAAEIKWNTRLRDLDDITLNIEKSYFGINSHRWELEKETYINYCHKELDVRDFLVSHEGQSIAINGSISENPMDRLEVIIKDLDLEDFTDIISFDKSVEGIANGKFYLSDYFVSPRLYGGIGVKDLILDYAEIGDIDLQGIWDNTKKAINVNGDLKYKGTRTFKIVGDYYLQQEKDNLDFKLKFDQTNINFLNSFMDPKVISNVKGYLDGNLVVKGELAHPLVSGYLDLKKGNVKVGMFGVNYGFSGKVNVMEDMIAIDYMPIIDEDGNRGYLNGGIIHENFDNFNFDVFVGLDDVRKPNGDQGSFLAMNTQYKEGDIYYGKAYVNGWVNVDGYLDNLNIEVNLKTNKNTSVIIPLYGSEEIDDVLSYAFISKDTLSATIKEEKIDFTGVNLNLNFDLTPDAVIKLVFDEKTGDEMYASGEGKISIKLDANNDLSMEGTYVLSKGAYNFVFNPIKKEFNVEKGSTISWKGGSPTDADLDITAIYKANTDLSVITPDLESQRSAGSNQNVDAKIFIRGNLNNPKLSFHLDAPKASESSKAALARINADTDELNKQFFMLLLSGRFQGTGVSASDYGNNAALEALSGQINNLLDAVSKDVRLNVDLKSNEQTGESSQAIGFEKNFLDDKLIIKGNFGVQNQSEGESNSSSFIGDINIEYLIDDAGNLRVSIFNESNNYSVMQDKNLGPFTQGISLIYSESFTNIKDMKLLNFVADWFRKDKYFKYTKRRRQKYIPEFQPEGYIEERE